MAGTLKIKKDHLGRPWRNIEWRPWDEVGMAVLYGMQRSEVRIEGRMSPKED